VLRKDRVQERTYQKNLAEEVLSGGNALLVLPTGLGKTVIACLVIAERLEAVGGRAVMLAPSRPLVDQHRKTLTEFLDAGEVGMLTGGETPRRRAQVWQTRRLLVATPQTAVNDARAGYLPDDIAVAVFDEAHRAVGDYAYVEFAKHLRKANPDVLILGLTASPGHEIEHIEEVAKNLGMVQVLVRTRDDADVAPYVAPVDVDWIEVQPSEVIEKATELLTKYFHDRLNKLRRYGFLRNRKNRQVRMADLTAVGAQIHTRRGRGGRTGYLFQATRQLSLARTGMHAANTVQREGIDAFLRFVAPKLKKGRSKQDASFVKDEHVERAIKIAKRWKGLSHPKLEPLVALLRQTAAPGRKILVFAELRDTVDYLVDFLRKADLQAEPFTGQGTREGRKGMTQKQQRAALDRFGQGAFPVLVATSIGEEGLDIPQVDLVVFFEPVASDIRLIQRSGRTGRDAPGRVVILTTDRSLDEKYLWSGLKREKRMKRLVRKLAQAGVQRLEREEEKPPEPPPRKSGGQLQLEEFA
jgi:Fanconi anemia group M protein